MVVFLFTTPGQGDQLPELDAQRDYDAITMPLPPPGGRTSGRMVVDLSLF